ncbi:MAG: hypothetical protein LIP11_16805 [Clostridiales bacterium]|nr:hypothetical protein [Clostridiales bacterium]
MGITSNKEQVIYTAAMEANQKEVRKMVMNSYQDMLDGKGRDYKDFFSELESRYKSANV